MNPLQLDALAIQKMASGHLCLNLSRRVEWEGFSDFAHGLLRTIGGEIVRKTDAPDMKLWDVKIDGANLQLVFDDYPIMTSLESSDHEGDAVLERLNPQLASAKNQFPK